MNGENSYGNDGWFGRNGSNAFSNINSSALGSQKDFSDCIKIENDQAEIHHLDINHSNTRLDKYLFYFSSKL